MPDIIEDKTGELKARRQNFKKLYPAVFVLVAFLVGWQFGQAGVPAPAAVTIIEKNREGAPKEADWQLLWDTIDQINEKYVDRPVDLLKILHGAVSGAVTALDDPYSVFLPPKEAGEFQEELRGTLEGIGAEIAIKSQKLTVVAPLDDSPAIRAGIRAGDYIAKVNGEDTKGMTLEQAVKKIRGPAGTTVTLTVFHKGTAEPEEITITRAKIVVKSLSVSARQYKGKEIAHLKLRRFGEDTYSEMNRQITNLLLQGVSGVILDVRNNPGGFLDTAIDIASFWIAEGQPVMIQKFGDGREQIYRAEGTPRLKGLPTVVLVNGGSASASEIVAGALRDYDIAKLVGEKSFGKGSVQEVINLRGGSDLKLTIAKWLTPDGHDLNKDGLEPDIKIELTDEDFSNDRDPQFDKALELLVP